jgi:hypothetical protein
VVALRTDRGAVEKWLSRATTKGPPCMCDNELPLTTSMPPLPRPDLCRCRCARRRLLQPPCPRGLPACCGGAAGTLRGLLRSPPLWPRRRPPRGAPPPLHAARAGGALLWPEDHRHRPPPFSHQVRRRGRPSSLLSVPHLSHARNALSPLLPRRYEECSASDPHIVAFWAVLEGFSQASGVAGGCVVYETLSISKDIDTDAPHRPTTPRS